MDEDQIEKIFITDEHLKVYAEKQALVYSYANEFQYQMFVKAIIDGGKFVKKMAMKNKKDKK